MEISKLSDQQLVKLLDNRYKQSDCVWDDIKRIYSRNTGYYDAFLFDENGRMINDNLPDYLRKLPTRLPKLRANRIFTDTEAVINALISNPPQPNTVPNRDTPEAIELALQIEKYFLKLYEKRDIKGTLRKALRNLFFSRLLAIKVFWNPAINDFDVKSLDPRKVRIAKNASNERTSDFVIEEITDNLEAVAARFPNKSKELLERFGYGDKNKDDIYIDNPDITYWEVWLGSYTCFKYQDLILDKIKNPYWDWDGVQITEEEALAMQEYGSKEVLQAAKERKEMGVEQENATQAYMYNHFDVPRKPYIFATVLNNEDRPIGRSDFISQAAPLQEAVDRRKIQIDENAEMVNGILKVDASVMTKADAQKIRFDTRGLVYGKGVKDGVLREFGAGLPAFVFEDMKDSREEIDNIMAATSAFRGEREGQETKGGRLALVEQSFLRLNELVQVIDYVCSEMFNWFYQIAKVKYTESHYAKIMGQDKAMEMITLTQDDFEDGAEISVISGKTLPEDKRFRFERAQADVEKGIIAPSDYFKEAGYTDPKQIAKNAVMFGLNQAKAVGITDEELMAIAPPPMATPPMVPPEMQPLQK